MLSSIEITKLLDPVIHRSIQAPNTKRRYLHDQFASFIVDSLNIKNARTYIANKAPCEHYSEIPPWEWIDSKLTSIFESHPQSIGIELESGLSTRFHRISSRLDWPLFSWISINTHDVDAYIASIFPTIDNFTHIGSTAPINKSASLLASSKHTIRVMVVGEQNPIKMWDDYCRLIDATVSSEEHDTKRTFICITHQIDAFTRLCRKHTLKTTVLDHIAHPPTDTSSLLDKLLHGMTLKKTQNTYTHLIEINHADV